MGVQDGRVERGVAHRRGAELWKVVPAGDRVQRENRPPLRAVTRCQMLYRAHDASLDVSSNAFSRKLDRLFQSDVPGFGFRILSRCTGEDVGDADPIFCPGTVEDFFVHRPSPSSSRL